MTKHIERLPVENNIYNSWSDNPVRAAKEIPSNASSIIIIAQKPKKHLKGSLIPQS